MKTLKTLLVGFVAILVTVACGTIQINTGSNEPTQSPAQPTQAPEQPAEPAPGGWRDDIPLPTGITNFVSTANETTCDTTNDLQTTADFYKTEMPKHGWTLDSETSTAIALNLIYTQDGETVQIGLTGSVNGTLIMIVVSPLLPDEPAAPTTAPAEPTTEPAAPTAQPTVAPTTPPAAPGGWRDDVPIPADANNLVRTSQEITFDTESDLRATADFYKTEMPKYGWTLTSETTTSIAIDLIFTKGDEEAVVGLVLSPLTTGTRVGIVID